MVEAFRKLKRSHTEKQQHLGLSSSVGSIFLLMPLVTRNFPLISKFGLLMTSYQSDSFESDCPSN